MVIDKLRPERVGVVLYLAALAGIAGVVLGGETTDRLRPADAGSPWVQHRRMPTLGEHLAAVETAIAQGDVVRAAYEWRDAYSLALGSRRWEAMADVGDAAVRIDALAARTGSRPGTFLAEARQAYLRALFQARNDRAPDGVARVADAFSALGDVETASRARTIGVAR